MGVTVLRMCEQVVPQLGEPAPALLGRPAVDVLLELVDLVVDCVEQVEEALGYVVNEVIRDLPWRQLVVVRVTDVAHTLWWERLPAARGLADSHDPAPRDHEVDLLVEDEVLLGHGDRHQQDPDDVAAVASDAGADARSVLLRGAQKLLDGLGPDVARQRVAKSRFVGVEQVGPRGPRHAARVLPASARRPRPRAGERLTLCASCPSSDESSRSASSADIAARARRGHGLSVRVVLTTSPAAKTPLMFVAVEPGCVSR